MRTNSLLSAVLPTLLLASGCAAYGPIGDEIDDVGVTAGRPDGEPFSACETGSVVSWLNSNSYIQTLRAAGLHEDAAAQLVLHRYGADAEERTRDDNPFDTIEEVDEVPWVGPEAFEALVAVAADRCELEHLFVGARDVHLPQVRFADDAVTGSYVTLPVASGGAIDFTLVGQNFEKVTDGVYGEPTWTSTSRLAQLCLQASAVRFEAMMANPPHTLFEMERVSNWGGEFTNRTTDYTGEVSGVPREGFKAEGRAGIWWISTLMPDGACVLPTYNFIRSLADSCAAMADAADGDFIDC